MPVYSDCITGLDGWGDELRCTLCQRQVSHPASLDHAGACGACLSRPQVLDRVWTYGPYQGGLRQLVHLLKYDGMMPLATTLGERSSKTADFRPEADLVVRAPLHWTRRIERGFNQSVLLAQVIARRSELPCVPRALRRKRATPPQSGLSGARRRASLRRAFEARCSLVEGRRVLLVDDVVTTGATIEACARSLKRAGAKRVTAVAVARAQVPQRAV